MNQRFDVGFCVGNGGEFGDQVAGVREVFVTDGAFSVFLDVCDTIFFDIVAELHSGFVADTPLVDGVEVLDGLALFIEGCGEISGSSSVVDFEIDVSFTDDEGVIALKEVLVFEQGVVWVFCLCAFEVFLRVVIAVVGEGFCAE